MIETELKLIMSENDYKSIHIHLNKTRDMYSFTQRNYYFDTLSSNLLKNGTTLRVRVKDDGLVLTLKAPINSIDSTVMVSKESSVQVTFEQFREWCIFTRDLNSLKEFVNQITNMHNLLDEDLVLLGSMLTNRTEINYNNFIISLDHNMYNEQIDYELEVEFKNEKPDEKVIKEAVELISSLGIDTTKVAVSKFKRFYKTIKNEVQNEN